MANHEGWYLKANVDISGLLQANKAANSLLATLNKVDAGLSKSHGNDSLAKTIKSADIATASYIERLKSEGKNYEADQEKAKLYATQIQRLSNRQNGLSKELERVAAASGKNSDAYNIQKARINQTATAINNFRSKLQATKNEMASANPSFIDKVKSKLASTNTEAAKTHSLFRSVFSANVLSNAATSAFSKLKDGISSAFNVGKEYNEQQQTMNATWLTLTGNAGKGSAMVKQINDMALAAQNSTEMVDGLSQKFYAINKSSSQTGQLTKDVLTLQDAFGQTDDAVMNFGTQFSQMMANQKVSAQDMMSFVNTFPEYRTQLLKTVNQQQGTKLSMKQMNDEMSKGKISSKTAIAALHTMAENYKNATGNFTKTLPGMRRVIQANGKRIAGELTKPFVNMKSPVASAVSKWIADKSTMNRFSRLGNTWASGLNNAMSKALGGNNAAGNTTKLLDKALDTLNSKSKQFFNWLGNHAKDLGTLTKSITTITGEVGKSVWHDFSSILINVGKATGLISKNPKGGALHQLAEGANNLAKNKFAIKAISDAIVAIAMTKGIKAATSPLLDLAGGAYRSYRKVKMLSDGIRGIKVTSELSDVEKHFYSIGDGARSAFNKVKDLFSVLKGGNAAGTGKLTNLVGGLTGNKTATMPKKLSWAKGMLQSTRSAGGFGNLTKAGKVATVGAGVGIAVDAGSQLVNAFKNRNSADKRSTDIGKGIGSAIGGGIGLYFGGPLGAAIGSQIGKAAGGWGGQAVNKFTKGWQRNKPPKNFWSMENLGWSTHDMFNKMGSGWNSFWAKRGNDMKAFGRSSGKWFSGIGKNFNKGVKGVKSWFTKLPSNIGKAGTSVKKWAKQTGDNIHKGWNKGIKASHNFFKNLPSNTRKTVAKMKSSWNSFWRSMPKKWNSFKTSFGKGWNSFWKKTGNQAKSSWNGTKRNWNSFWRSMPKKWSSFKSSFSKSWNSTWRRVGSWAKSSWNGTKKNWNNFVDSMPKKWNSFKSSFAKNWSGFWNGLKKNITSFFDDVGKKWQDFKQTLGSIGDNIKKGTTKGINNVLGFANDIAYAKGGSHHTFKYLKSHAEGGKIAATHGALVGEAGPELAYKPNGSNARLLGVNGPEITKVHSGEHILNARDTSKVMSGGLGKGLALKGYVNGTTGLTKSTKKVSEDYKETTSKSSKLLTNFSRKSKNIWKGITSHTKSQTAKTRRNAVSEFSSMTRSVNKQTDKTRKNSISDFTSMRKGVHSQMDKLHDGVIDLGNSTSKGFGKAMDKMHDYARSAMSDTIDQINKGINGIDKVLSQFGGNASVIKPVKFATGTDSNGRLTENTLAMLNDAESGPRQEAVVTDKDEVFLPQGRNAVMPLKKGWGVLNGTQTQQLGLRHFAKGSGVSHSQLKKIASKNGADPAGSFKSMFSSMITAGKTALAQGTNGLAKNSSSKFGVPWNNAMWTVINDAIGSANGKGGTREAFLKYAEATFSGVPYVMGAMSKAASDCSGMVAQALKHFGINIGRSTVDMQNSSGVQYLGKNLANTVPGDLVIFGHGTGAAGHVGIIKNPKTGTMFNETPPKARVTDIASDKSMGYGYYRVKGLHNASSKKEKSMKADKSLIALAKRQLGTSAIKWIKDKLGDEGSLGGNIGGEGVQRWAGTVKKILGMLHLSTSSAMVNKVLRQIDTESKGDPHARQPGADPDGDGSGPALGLMQTKRGTFEAYKKPGDTGGVFNGPSDIYAGLNYAKHKYGNNLNGLGEGHGYAVGGDPPVGQNVLVGEKGPEVAHFKQPVHIYSNEQSKHLVNNKVPKKIMTRMQAPTINININGNVSSRNDATKLGNIIKEKVAEVLYDLMGEEYGADLSVY